MRVDFYQMSRDPVERVIVQLAGKVLAAGASLLVVAEDAELRGALSQALWKADGFLANGAADEPGAARQPILLSAECAALNGATMLLLADGVWRDHAVGFDRAMLLFGEDATAAARELWKDLKGRKDIEPRIFKQTPEGGWREGA